MGWIVALVLTLCFFWYHKKYIKRLKAEFKSQEKAIREDAITRSKNVTRGHVSEQLLPLLPGFKYNVSDAKFLGFPVDYIIYEGMSKLRDTGEGDITVVLAEIKQKSSHKNKIQRKIKEAIDNGRVRFETIKIDYEFNSKTSNQSRTISGQTQDKTGS